MSSAPTRAPGRSTRRCRHRRLPGSYARRPFTAPGSGAYSVPCCNVLFEGYLGAGANPLPAGVPGCRRELQRRRTARTRPAYAPNNRHPEDGPGRVRRPALASLGPDFSIAIALALDVAAGAHPRRRSSLPPDRRVNIITVSDVGGVRRHVESPRVTVGGRSRRQTTGHPRSAGPFSGTITSRPGCRRVTLSIVVTTSSETVTESIQVLGAPTITLTPANGGPGTTVAVSGRRLRPEQDTAGLRRPRRPERACLLPDGPTPAPACNWTRAAASPCAARYADTSPANPITDRDRGRARAASRPLPWSRSRRDLVIAAQTSAATAPSPRFTVNSDQCTRADRHQHAAPAVRRTRTSRRR